MTYHEPMRRVLSNLHYRLCCFVRVNTTKRGRDLAQRTILAMGVVAFGAMLLAHVSFVHRAITNLPEDRPEKNIPLSCLPSIRGFSKDVDVTHLVLMNETPNTNTTRSQGSHASTALMMKELDPFNNFVKACDSDNVEAQTCYTLHPRDVHFSYSKEKGYLQLSSELLAKHGISVQYVVVSKTDANCFGEDTLQFLVSVFGTDTVLVNWLLGAYDSHGFILNAKSKVIVDLRRYSTLQTLDETCLADDGTNIAYKRFRWYEQALSKCGMILKTSFLFFITTTLVSFTLRETQERMLEFTLNLEHRYQHSQPVVDIVLTHIIENLVFVPIMVGIIFFLIEFYQGDKFLAFIVLSIVWVCEAFAVVCLRSHQGRHFFPRMFFLLFTVFHYYLFSFPFGFTYVGIGVTALGMLLLMHVFFYKFEIESPASDNPGSNPGSVTGAGQFLVRRQPDSPARGESMRLEIVNSEPSTPNAFHRGESPRFEDTREDVALNRSLSQPTHTLARGVDRPDTHRISSNNADDRIESVVDALAQRSPFPDVQSRQSSLGSLKTKDAAMPCTEECLAAPRDFPKEDGEMQAAEPSAEKASPSPPRE